jgi:branched-chain amino acid transport system permease protein
MSWIRSGDFIVMIVLGGISLTWGPVLGTAAFLVLELMLSSWTTFWQLPFGIIIILIVTFLHRGLVDLWSPLIRVGRYLRRD